MFKVKKKILTKLGDFFLDFSKIIFAILVLPFILDNNKMSSNSFAISIFIGISFLSVGLYFINKEE